MNQAASSSQIPDIFVPAFEWGDGHASRFTTAERLTHGRFAAQTIVVIDSCFTQAVYGQHTEKHDERRIHHIQTLHANKMKLEDDAKMVVLQAYETSKDTLFNFYENSTESFMEAQSLAGELISFFPTGVQNNAGIEALSWCVQHVNFNATYLIKYVIGAPWLTQWLSTRYRPSN